MAKPTAAQFSTPVLALLTLMQGKPAMTVRYGAAGLMRRLGRQCVSRILRMSSATLWLALALTTACCSGVVPQSSKLIGTSTLDSLFRLGPGDRLKVTVFGEEELSGEVEIDGSGTAQMPLIGPMPAKGKTLDEFAASLRARLSQGYLNNPKVGAQVINYRPIYVQGEVRRAGEFPYKVGLKLADAVALAGGYSYRADESIIELRRAGDSTLHTIRIDGEIAILPGDNIRILERFF